MFLGYNTNGFAHHRLRDAIEIMAELGYRGVALTPDVNHLDPQESNFPGQGSDFQEAISPLSLTVVIETGARFILNPRRKHQPTLLSAHASEREQRAGFLRNCIGFAQELHATHVSFWAGTATSDESSSTLMARLVDECKHLADYAEKYHVWLAFEPEPGMFIDTMDKFAELHARVNHPHFGLTIDIGHLVCMNELPVSQHLVEWKDWLWNVHIEDMVRGVHDHVMFGEGEVDFEDVFAGLQAANYQGGIYVELSRHSHDAVNTASKSMEFLTPYLAKYGK
jgi:L-ribulose-5-phosphate 3-epimerase